MSRHSGQHLEEGKENWLKELDQRISNLEECGENLAIAEKDYRMALSKKLLNLIDVRSGQIKIEIAKGDVHIAEKRLHRDIAKIKYDTTQQSIFQAKIELGVIREDILHERIQR